MGKIKKGPVIIGMFGLIAALAVLWRSGIVTSALFDESKAVHIDDLDAVENSTLMIGTHLIYLHAMNDQIYEIAMDSASASGQDRVYYKSELAGGMWYDITDAGSIQDITSSGSIADKSELEKLFFTHHTKSDGKTYDLSTNQAVCIFDINSVYSVEALPELEALKLQYDLMVQTKSSTKTDRRNRELVENFFKTQTESDTTMECDMQMDALQGYYLYLSDTGADAKEIETLLEVMEKIDNTRKAAVFTKLDAELATLQDTIADISSQDGIEMDDALLVAIGDSQSALAESLGKAEGNLLEKGSTAISETWYTLAIELVQQAEGGDYTACAQPLQKLKALENISAGKIVDAAEELTVLESLIEKADVNFGVALSSGVTQDYQELAAQGASHAALQNRIEEDTADASAAKAELLFLVQAAADRKSNEDVQAYVQDRIQGAAKFRSVIQDDAFAPQYRDMVTQYVTALSAMLDSLKGSGDSQSKAQNLYEQKADLQEQKLKALDMLDIDTAKRIAAQIAAVDEEIDAQENADAAVLEDLLGQKAKVEKALEDTPQVELSRIEAQIAVKNAELADGSAAASIMETKNDVMALLDGGDTSQSALDTIAGDIDALESMLDGGSPLALAALKEIYGKMDVKAELEGEDAYASLQETIEDAVAESSVHASLSGGLRAEDFLAVLADSLGVDSVMAAGGSLSDEVSDEDATALLLALGEFGRRTQRPSGESDALALAQSIAALLYQGNKGIVFETFETIEDAYVPVEFLAAYAGYRYVWNDTKMNAVLSRGRCFYSFTAFRELVEMEDAKSETMDAPAAFKGGLFIPGSYVEEQFGCSVHEIYGTDYSVLANNSVMERSQELLNDLLERGGY